MSEVIQFVGLCFGLPLLIAVVLSGRVASLVVVPAVAALGAVAATILAVGPVAEHLP